MRGVRERLRRLRDDDAGTTLVELVVAMALMTVFLAMFTTSILSVTKTATKVRAISTSSLQSNNAYLRLDNLVRYANAISAPKFDTTTGMWHVEWASTSVSRSTDQDTVSSSDSCSQLRIAPATKQLQLRSWKVDQSSSTGRSQLTNWLPIASFVVNGGSAADVPFSLPALRGAASTGLQQLTINLVTAAPNNTSGNTTSNFTFTALNSAGAAGATSPVCQQVGVGDST